MRNWLDEVVCDCWAYLNWWDCVECRWGYLGNEHIGRLNACLDSWLNRDGIYKIRNRLNGICWSWIGGLRCWWCIVSSWCDRLYVIIVVGDGWGISCGCDRLNRLNRLNVIIIIGDSWCWLNRYWWWIGCSWRISCSWWICCSWRLNVIIVGGWNVCSWLNRCGGWIGCVWGLCWWKIGSGWIIICDRGDVGLPYNSTITVWIVCSNLRSILSTQIIIHTAYPIVIACRDNIWANGWSVITKCP